MSNDWPPQFIFAVCQRGAEHSLKREIAAGPIDARPAFSRPGFVTFKLTAPCEQPEQFQLPSTFARTHGFCLGKVAGEYSSKLAEQVWTLPAIEQLSSIYSIGDLHVWQRDSGIHKSLPGPTLLAKEIEAVLRQHTPIDALRSIPSEPRSPSPRNRWVLDVVLVEPGEWWIGCHRATRRFDCWPGGVPHLQLPEHAASRAYLKMVEALIWSGLPLARGDLCLELGSAPGGTAQSLLEAGLQVLGVDPAEIDPEVIAHPCFRHLRRRSNEVPRKELRGVRWLAADMNVTPTYTLDSVEEIVTSKATSIRGMILTLKFSDWKFAEQLPSYIERVQSWGFRDVRTRQLASGRQEICLVAMRSRGQRRVHRPSRRRQRTDAAHASMPPGFHLA